MEKITPASLDWKTSAFLPRVLLNLARLGFRKGLARSAGIIGKEIEVSVGPIPLVLDFRKPYERHLFLGLTDRHLFGAYREILRQGDLAIDIGANIGFHSAYMANCVGNRGRIYAFEPGPEALVRLRRLGERNPLQNISVISKAVSNREQRIQFYQSKDLVLSSALYDWDSSTDKRRINVEAITLDAFLEELGWPRVRLVKIDVEGYECQVFEGLERALVKQSVDFYIFEVAPPGHPAGHDCLGWLFQKFQTSGYQVKRFYQDRLFTLTSESDVRKAAPSFDLMAIRSTS